MTMCQVRAGEGEANWVVGDTYPPGSGPPPHVHTREDEAFYLLSGVLEIYAGDEQTVARAGDFVYLPRGIVHCFTNPTVNPARALILAAPGGFERSSPRPARRPCRASRPRQPLWENSMPDARTIFASVDSLDPRALTEFIADDATMVFGNGEPLAGSAAIIAASEAFLATVKGLRHRIRREWTVEDTTIADTEVTYTRLDGKDVTVPVVSIWQVGEDGLITDYRVFLDLAPVYAP